MLTKEEVINNIIDVEGGYVNDVNDSGGETNFGITVKVARQYGYMSTMRDMPRYIAFDIYGIKYWDAVRADDILKLSEIVAEEVVDTGVNMGVGRAGMFLQRSLNVLNNKEQHYKDIKVDGDIGKNTIVALESYLLHRNELVLSRMLNSLQGAFYVELAERREKDERFIYGWFKNRVVM